MPTFTLTAVDSGPAGNAITFEVTGPPTHNLSFAITVVGNAISVQVATDNTGTSTTLCGDMFNALQADPAVAALVTMSNNDTPALPFTSPIGPFNLAGGSDSGGANGEDLNLQGIPVTDGGFVCRAWNGAYSVLDQMAGSLGQIQIYGQNKDKWFDNPVSVYTPNPTMQCASVIPEKAYVVDSAIRFDLLNTFAAAPMGELAFYGVRRIAGSGMSSDPAPSFYPFYQKPFQIPVSFTITAAYDPSLPLLSQSQRVQVAISDYDFVLRHIIKYCVDGNGVALTVASPFAVLLYDSVYRARMNYPLLAELLMDDTGVTQGRNFFPSPPIMYAVNRSITFDIFTLLDSAVTLPVTVNLLLDGYRRIPCN